MDIENRDKDSENELSFLYGKLAFIRINTIKAMAFVPEYVEAIKAYEGKLNDKAVYEIVRNAYVQILKSLKPHKLAKEIVRDISKDVMGDHMAWKTGIPVELSDPNLIRKIARGYCFTNPTEYEKVKEKFFIMVKNKYKQGDNAEKKIYFSTRSIVETYAKILTGDKKSWRKDYNEYPKESADVKQAAINGDFKEFELSKLDAELQKDFDRNLPDADDDL